MPGWVCLLTIIIKATIPPKLARQKPKKAAVDICPGDLVYVEFDEAEWHLGRVILRSSALKLEVKFHDGEVAMVDFKAEKHCMARHGRFFFST